MKQKNTNELTAEGFMTILPYFEVVMTDYIPKPLRLYYNEVSPERLFPDYVYRDSIKGSFLESENFENWKHFKGEVVEALKLGSLEVFAVKTRRKKNRIKCNHCGSVIESTHRHDMVWCSCGSVYTDGGMDYFRRGGYPEIDYVEIV